MKDVTIDPSSESEVLRAAAILLIRILGARVGPWADEGDAIRAREVTLQIEIEEILKGEVREDVREPFEHRVLQRLPEGTRISDYHGLWSHAPLAEGTRLLAFCRGSSDDATVLLTEEHCEQLLDPREALEDTRAALALEAEGLPPLEILARAEAMAAERGPIFARYVLAKSKPAAAVSSAPPPAAAMALAAPDEQPAPALQDQAFEELMRRLEDPRTPPLSRDAYLRSIYQELGLMSAPPPARVDRLIEALRRLLLLPEAAPLHQNIQEVYLPNLLKLDRGGKGE